MSKKTYHKYNSKIQQLNIYIILIWMFSSAIFIFNIIYIFSGIDKTGISDIVLITIISLIISIILTIAINLYKGTIPHTPDPPGTYIGPRNFVFTPVNPPTSTSKTEQLEKLTQMLEKGYITRAEFEEQKQDILRRRP